MKKKVYLDYSTPIQSIAQEKELCLTVEGEIESYEGQLPNFATRIIPPKLSDPTNHAQYPHVTWGNFCDTLARIWGLGDKADSELCAELMVTMTFIPSVGRFSVFGQLYHETHELVLTHPSHDGFIPEGQWVTLWGQS